MRLPWSDIKSLVDTGQVKLKYIELSNKYNVFGYDSGFSVYGYIDKNPNDTSDLDDFEANYKTQGSAVLDPSDSDGVSMMRTKITKAGWHFQAHCVEFETAKVDSVYNKDNAGDDLGFTSIKFFKDDDTEVTTQTDIDLYCVRTEVYWEPVHDIDLIGGTLFQTLPPASDVRLWIVGAPDIPKIYGGSVDFIQGGLNLRRLGSNVLDLDGVTTKTLTYDPTYHTSKFKFVVRHGVGIKVPVFLTFKSFKSGTV